MTGSRAAAVLTGMVLLLAPTAAAADDSGRRPVFAPGAAGIGDPYFPLDGNGGYDVHHYDLDLRYDPASDVLTGRATLTANATQDLSSFNLDLSGLEVRSVQVDGRPAAWTRDADEMTVEPARGIKDRSRFRVEIRYDGVPQTIEDQFGISGFLHTDDGAVVAGQPHVAATWYPVNDHPVDTASYSFAVEVPEGLEAVANGVLRDHRTTDDGWARWRWEARDPMASYLATLAIGEFDVHEYSAGGIRYWDALDPDLFNGDPRTGDAAAIAGSQASGYTRLTRTLDVPADGASVSFWVDRDTEPAFDFFLVEARVAGTDDWTTLPDATGHASQDTGFGCPFWLGVHPFLEHYQTSQGEEGPCLPTGTTGEWWAAAGPSDGYERWEIELDDYAGQRVELSLAYVTDPVFQLSGVLVDDVVVSTGEGTTSFEDDGDTLDGWAVTGPPPGSAPVGEGWVVGTSADVPASYGERATASFARQPEITDFLAELFGRYPFRVSGGIVDDTEELGFALETQTRPIYSKFFFLDPLAADSVVVHELAHQWVGDDLPVERWQHIWLNEGFATYTEWLWREREGLGTAQETFDLVAGLPSELSFWQLTIGDPGPEALFDRAVYDRGAMTLHALRLEVGDDTFFRILRRWVATQSGGRVTTDEFVALAERLSGRELDELFETWLFTPAKPAGLPDAPLPGEPPAEGLAASTTSSRAAATSLPAAGHRPVADERTSRR